MNRLTGEHSGDSPDGTMLSAALAYARSDIPVFPVNGKQPLTQRGHKDATTDIDQITEWWTRSPTAGIAMPTGRITERVVIDIDIKPGTDGEGTLRAWQEENGDLPHTLTTGTGGGGKHLHFAYPEGVDRIPSGRNVLGPGVDVRADGGYVVLPPSFHASGNRYAWIEEEGDVVEELPEALLSALSVAPGTQTPATVPSARRFTRNNPCPVCHGGKDDHEGVGLRCWGFLSSDDRFAHCSREEHAPNLSKNPDGTFAHLLGSEGCRCGQTHAVRKLVEESKPHGSDTRAISLRLVGDLLREPAKTTEWVVENLLPTGGLSLIAAKPKVGKSTLARQLAVAVSRGEPFLERATVQGSVIYLAFEEKESEALAHLRLMGVTDEPIHTYFGTAPRKAIEELRRLTEEIHPVLIIVDTLFRVARVRDANDYAQMTQALEPLLALARDTGSHVVAIHHSGKNDREGPEAILGSTAIFGTVDTAILLRLGHRYRTISTRQRYGTDLESTVLEFDRSRKTASLAGKLEEAEEQRLRGEIVKFFSGRETRATETEICDSVHGDRDLKRRILRDRTIFERSGEGKRGDPYLYWPKEAEACRPIADSTGHPQRDLAEPSTSSGYLSRGESLTRPETEKSEFLDSTADILAEPFHRRNRRSQPISRPSSCSGFRGSDPHGPCNACGDPQISHIWSSVAVQEETTPGAAARGKGKEPQHEVVA